MTATKSKENSSSPASSASEGKQEQRRGNNRGGDRRGRRSDRRNQDRDSEWQERVIQIRRVSKTVKGGKKMSFRAIVVRDTFNNLAARLIDMDEANSPFKVWLIRRFL